MEARVRHSRNQIKSDQKQIYSDLELEMELMSCIAEPEHGIGIGNTVTASIPARAHRYPNNLRFGPSSV
jgi:hypothetical protein